MEESLDHYTTGGGSVILSSPIEPQNTIQVSGSAGNALFTIKSNGEFVPGPGLTDSEALSETAKTFYKNMTMFGKSFAQTLEDKDKKIKELEETITKIKNGTFD
jgi:hypothetical protein